MVEISGNAVTVFLYREKKVVKKAGVSTRISIVHVSLGRSSARAFRSRTLFDKDEPALSWLVRRQRFAHSSVKE